MVTGYKELAPAQTDRNSPISETLMDTIRTNLDALNKHLDGLEEGTGGGDGGGGDGTFTAKRKIVADIQGNLSGIQSGLPIDFPHSLNEGALTKAKVLFQDLTNIRKPFTGSVQLFRRKNVNLVAKDVTSHATISNPVLSVEVKDVEMTMARSAVDSYTDLQEWGEDGIDAEWFIHNGKNGLIKVSGDFDTDVWNIWTSKIGIALKSTATEEILTANIIGGHYGNRVLFFEIENAIPGAGDAPAGLKVITKGVWSIVRTNGFTIDDSNGQVAELGTGTYFTSVTVQGFLDTQRQLVFTQSEVDRGDNRTIQGVVNIATTGEIRSGQVILTNTESIPSIFNWEDIFSENSVITIKKKSDNKIISYGSRAMRYSGNQILVSNIFKDSGETTVKVTAERKIWRIGNAVSAIDNFNIGDEIFVNNNENGALDSPNSEDRRSVKIVDKISDSTNNVGYLIVEERASNFPFKTTDYTLVNGLESSRLRIVFPAEIDHGITVRDFVSLVDFNGNHRELYRVSQVNTAGNYIVIQTGGDIDNARSGAVGFARGITGNSRAAVRINAIYRALSGAQGFSSEGFIYLDGSQERTLSLLAGQDVVNSSDFTLSLVLRNLVDSLSGISVEVE